MIWAWERRWGTRAAPICRRAWCTGAAATISCRSWLPGLRREGRRWATCSSGSRTNPTLLAAARNAQRSSGRMPADAGRRDDAGPAPGPLDAADHQRRDAGLPPLRPAAARAGHREQRAVAPAGGMVEAGPAAEPARPATRAARSTGSRRPAATCSPTWCASPPGPAAITCARPARSGRCTRPAAKPFVARVACSACGGALHPWEVDFEPAPRRVPRPRLKGIRHATDRSHPPRDQRHRRRRPPYLRGAWTPLHEEVNASGLEVIAGRIPTDIDGVYLRNTQNPVYQSLGRYHPFDGDGMIHMISFRDGRRTTATASSTPRACAPSRRPATGCGPG